MLSIICTATTVHRSAAMAGAFSGVAAKTVAVHATAVQKDRNTNAATALRPPRNEMQLACRVVELHDELVQEGRSQMAERGAL